MSISLLCVTPSFQRFSKFSNGSRVNSKFFISAKCKKISLRCCLYPIRQLWPPAVIAAVAKDNPVSSGIRLP